MTYLIKVIPRNETKWRNYGTSKTKVIAEEVKAAIIKLDWAKKVKIEKMKLKPIEEVIADYEREQERKRMRS